MANDTLIKNLENQLERLVDELADADAYKYVVARFSNVYSL